MIFLSDDFYNKFEVSGPAAELSGGGPFGTPARPSGGQQSLSARHFGRLGQSGNNLAVARSYNWCEGKGADVLGDWAKAEIFWLLADHIVGVRGKGQTFWAPGPKRKYSGRWQSMCAMSKLHMSRCPRRVQAIAIKSKHDANHYVQFTIPQ